MITMVGNHVCKDCVAALEVIEREHLPIEFHDMEKALDYVKEFLKLREGHPEIFDACRKENQIGIPLFVLEDGTVTLDCETAFEAARRVKRPVVFMVGSHLCKACREKLGVIREKELKVEFHDIVENMQDMRLFLKIREGNPELYEEIRKEGCVGIPVFILPDGTITRDSALALETAEKLK